MKPFTSRFHLICALAFSALAGNAAPLGTAFTYQGRLNDGANAANNLYDLDFALFDVPTGGSQMGLSVTYSGLPVSNGLFTVTLDFGASPFTGDARWLQILVRTNGGRTTPWTPLNPRQPLTPTSYSLYAPSAGSAVTASNVAPFSITAGSIADGTITAGKLASGQVVKSLNGLFDVVTLSAGTNVTLTPSGNDLKISATPGTVVTNAGWGIAGNSGTTAANFLGTLDGQPLELRVNGQRALRLEPGASGAPNVVGGSVSNRVAAGVIGATIAGGGNSLDGAHRIEANYGSIGGGYQNTLQTGANLSTIAGGYGNTIQSSAMLSSISGGTANSIQTNAFLSAIGGGSDNLIQVNAKYATIAGGEHNTIETDAYRSTIGGGSDNLIQANAKFSTIAGGEQNTIQTDAACATIGGGSNQRIESNATNSFIGGGYRNTIQSNAWDATIAGGYGNTIWPNAYDVTIGGGFLNTIQAYTTEATIGGGGANTIQSHAYDSTIGGGAGNTIQTNANYATIGGGFLDTIQTHAIGATIGGGEQNTIQTDAYYATIGGGYQNTVQTDAASATIGGGYHNTIQTHAFGATIGGGYHNTNQPNAVFATIPGGLSNEATNYAFAAGHNAHALHTGAFVWSDGGGTETVSTDANSVTFRARGGYRLFTSAASVGVSLAAGSGTWTSMSDRNAKENFEAVNPREVLDKVAALPVSRWNYKTQAASVRHVGPMAQDFQAAFAVGESDTGITTVDADGVALAAIQGLNQKLEANNAALEQELAELKTLVKALAEKVNEGAR